MKKHVNPHLYYYALTVLLIFISKWYFSVSDIDDLKSMFYPLVFAIEAFTGFTLQYLPNQGYFESHLNFLITKSCLGFNFILISFGCAAFIFSRYFYLGKFAWMRFLLLVLATILFGFIVNAFRILSLALSEHYIAEANSHQGWMHETFGAMIFIAALLIYTFLLFKMNQKYYTPEVRGISPRRIS